MDYSEEVQGKRLHDRYNKTMLTRCIWVPYPVIIGAGPSGLAVAACLREKGYKSEKSKEQCGARQVHVLPQEMLGKSTFGLSMGLLKWFPVSLVDRFLLLVSRFIMGDAGKLGIHRPKLGPLELKSQCGKTPVSDVGTLAKIQNGDIKVCPGIKRIIHRTVEFVDGRKEDFDSIILATGYKSNVPHWLKEGDLLSEEDGMPREAFPRGWKVERGLYVVGFTKRGLLGASFDAKMIAEDIELQWKPEATNLLPYIQPLTL